MTAMLTRLIILLIILFPSVSSTVWGATYYVDCAADGDAGGLEFPRLPTWLENDSEGERFLILGW